MRTDIIELYANRKAPRSQCWRWRQRDFSNGKIIGASTEGYSSLRKCKFNLLRVTGIELPRLSRTVKRHRYKVWTSGRRYNYEVTEL